MERVTATPATVKILDDARTGCGHLAELLRLATVDYSVGVPWPEVETHMATCGNCAPWGVTPAR